jgi:hypothetical protein
MGRYMGTGSCEEIVCMVLRPEIGRGTFAAELMSCAGESSLGSPYASGVSKSGP